MQNKPTFTRETLEQLAQLDQSLSYVQRILAGVVLAYCSTVQERERLLRTALGQPAACSPDPFPLQTGSRLLILTALFFFAKQSRRTLETARPADRCSAEIGHVGNLLILAVALARLADVLRVTCVSQPTGATGGTEVTAQTAQTNALGEF